jgi:hypothetical protein
MQVNQRPRSRVTNWINLKLGSMLCAALGLAMSSSAPAFDQLFDYTSFETGFGQAQFDVLNYPSLNSHYMMTSTDNHRPETVANGLGAATGASHSQGDADGDGDVDGADFLFWQRQLGRTMASGGAAGIAEPPSQCVVVMALVAAAGASRLWPRTR